MALSVLGVDIGGTKVAAGLVSEAGEILSQVRVPMVAGGSSQEGFNSVCRAIDSAMKQATQKIQAIGVSSPGPLDPKRGVILKTPNLPCWRDFPLLDELEKKYGLPTRVENDANAAGLAEAIWGAAAEYNYVFYVTIGTGLGTAIIQDKRIYHGRTGLAAEGGHMTIDMNAPVRCGCGKRGCVESMVSGPAIALRGRERLTHSGRNGGVLREMARANSISSEEIFKAAESDDPLANEIIQQTIELLSLWLGNVVDLLEPDVIVVGGGVGARLTKWLAAVRAGIPQWSINPRAHEMPLLSARYGADSGLAGAAALWLPNLARNQVASPSSKD